MRFDPMRYPASADGERTELDDGEPYTGNDIGWIDPRALDEDGELLSPRELEARDGELAWPDRFSRATDRNFETELGPIGYSGQYMQSPTPGSGNIFKREYWQDYIVPTEGSRKGRFPDMDIILVSVDSAFTESLWLSSCTASNGLSPTRSPRRRATGKTRGWSGRSPWRS
jgi:hypothetical protein